MNKLTAIALISLAVILAGCAASDPGAGFSESEELHPSDFDYLPPEASPEVENTFEVNERFEVVWDRIIGNVEDRLFGVDDKDNPPLEVLVADPPFKVESADKETGLITLSYSFHDATQYVDCGRSHRTFEFQDQFEEYKYPTAADITFKEMATWKDGSDYKPAVRETSRNTELEGVVEVLLTPQGEITELKAEITYELTMFFRTRFDEYSSMDGEIVGGFETINWKGQDLPNIEYPSFTTGESATETFYEGTVFEKTATCVPKGTLEARIFEMAES